MFCSNCGSQNDDNSKFCTKCSTPLQASAAVPQPPAAKKKTLRTVIIAVVCLIVAFVLWVEFSPDNAATNTDLTTTAATTTATTAAIVAPETTAAPAEPTQPAATVAPTQAPVATTKTVTLSAANNEEEALTMIRQLTGLTNAEFYREEDFIFNDDGTLSIDVNTPELATATCFIICENGYAGDGYDNCFIVLKGTDQIYTAQAGGTGIMEQIH